MKARILVIATMSLALGLSLAGQPLCARSPADGGADTTEVVTGDRCLRGQVVRNDATIKGDLFLWGQNVSSWGKVEGDVIGAGQDVSVHGEVLGNVRAAGSHVTLSGPIGKNVTLLANSIILSPGASVGGSATIFGQYADLEGKVNGRTTIGARNVVLGGEFFGDVNVNQLDRTKRRFHDRRFARMGDGRRWSTKLTVLPGTKIHGTLRFGGTDADVQKGAEIKDFQWTKPSLEGQGWRTRGVYWYGWKFIRLLFTTAVYFLLGLVLVKLFPTSAQAVADCVVARPGSSVGFGLVGVFSTIVTFIACVVLLVLSVIMSPALGITATVAAAAVYTSLFYLAALPAALWLGSLMQKERTLPWRLGSGLVVLEVGLFLIMLLGKIPTVGPAFSVIAVLVKVGVILLGSGALLAGIKALWTARLRGEAC